MFLYPTEQIPDTRVMHKELNRSGSKEIFIGLKL